MDKSFKGIYIPFFLRLLKRLIPVILIMLFALFKIYFGRASRGNLANYRVEFLIFLAICFIIGVYYHVDKIRTVVNEVRLSNDNLIIIGHDFYSKFEDSLDINKTMLEIQVQDPSKNKRHYCLEIYSEDKYYYLNKFNDWQYATLIEIVEEYKLKTGKTVSGMDYYSELVNKH